jgi:hypothetical protein
MSSMIYFENGNYDSQDVYECTGLQKNANTHTFTFRSVNDSERVLCVEKRDVTTFTVCKRYNLFIGMTEE